LINIRRRYLKGAGMRGFHLRNESEISMMVEPWVRATLSGWSPVIWIPMKGILEAVKPREEGLIKSPIKPEPLYRSGETCFILLIGGIGIYYRSE
jgi:hypothetical protein